MCALVTGVQTCALPILFVARHGTLGRAGAALHVEATTVSRRVSALEASLGQTLFERAPSGFVLTAAGRALVPHAEAMAAAAARIHKADQGGSGLSGQLRVSVSEGFGNSFIAPRLGRFVAAHPELDIRSEERRVGDKCVST